MIYREITSRQEWLIWRREDVTASTVGALFGVHDWTSYYQLWAMKTGRLDPSSEENPAMRRGRHFEATALAMLQEDRPELEIWKGTTYAQDEDLRLGATPDAFFTDAEGRRGIIQIKSVSARAYREKWRTSEGEIEPPLWICLQAITEAHLCGCELAAVAPLVVGDNGEIELPLIYVDLARHIRVWDSIVAHVKAFWELVDAGTELKPDYARDKSALEEIYSSITEGKVLDLTERQEEVEKWRADDLVWAGIEKDAHRERAQIKARLIDTLRDASVAMIGSKVFATRRQVNKKGFTVEPAVYVRTAFVKERKKKPEPELDAVCPKCEGGGWEYYGLGYNDPHFRECTECHNPKGYPSP